MFVMIKNAIKIQMLFALMAFFVTSCSRNQSSIQRKSPTAHNSSHVRKNVTQEAKRQIGVKYKYGGKTPSGFDCSGFTRYVYDKVNIALSPSSTLQARQGKKVNLKWAKKGDLLFFGSGGRINHVALITANEKDGIYVVHSTSSRGVIEENVSRSSYWNRRIMFARTVLDY
jgi:cell wall-associated NlpC family hydrolase